MRLVPFFLIAIALPSLASGARADVSAHVKQTSSPFLIAPQSRLRGLEEVLDRRSLGPPKRLPNKGQNPVTRPSSRVQPGKKTKPQAGKSKAPTGKAKTKKGASCRRRKVHRRSIYESLFARADLECDYVLTLAGGPQPGTVIIPAGSKDLGSTASEVSSGSLQVFGISNWGQTQGRFIAKKLFEQQPNPTQAQAMSAEVANLKALEELMASGENADEGHKGESWIVMKEVPGERLRRPGGPWDALKAKKLPLAEENAVIQGWQNALIQEVMSTYKKLGGKIHGDIKDTNIHWTGADGNLVPKLIDWGNVFPVASAHIGKRIATCGKKGFTLSKKTNPGEKNHENARTYARCRAEVVFPLRES